MSDMRNQDPWKRLILRGMNRMFSECDSCVKELGRNWGSKHLQNNYNSCLWLPGLNSCDTIIFILCNEYINQQKATSNPLLFFQKASKCKIPMWKSSIILLFNKFIQITKSEINLLVNALKIFINYEFICLFFLYIPILSIIFLRNVYY